MTEDAQLNVLRTSSVVKRLLGQDFDFSPLQAAGQSSLFHLGENTGCELIGKDVSGGEFALCSNSSFLERPLLYVSSEGQAGIIGHNLNEGLSIIIAIPYWQECLKFSASGQLQEMRQVVPVLESEVKDSSRLDSSRQALRAQLLLENIADPVQSLYTAVKELSPLFPAFGKDNWKFDILFNKFTIPAWRRKLFGSA